MASPIQTPEMRDTYEWEHLDEYARGAGHRLVRSMIGIMSQDTLPGLEKDSVFSGLRDRIRQNYPDSLLVDSDLFDEMRYQAGIEASGISDEQIAAANSSDMWDLVMNNLRREITDRSPNHYEFSLSTYVITPEAAARTFAADYREIAEDRLNGFRLVHFIDELPELSDEQYEGYLNTKNFEAAREDLDYEGDEL